MTIKRERPRNKPIEKPGKPLNFIPVFEGSKRTVCKECYNNEKHKILKYMDRSTKQFRPAENLKKTKRVCVILYCDICRSVIWNEEGLKQIPK